LLLRNCRQPFPAFSFSLFKDSSTKPRSIVPPEKTLHDQASQAFELRGVSIMISKNPSNLANEVVVAYFGRSEDAEHAIDDLLAEGLNHARSAQPFAAAAWLPIRQQKIQVMSAARPYAPPSTRTPLAPARHPTRAR
jgi:hypothetical protein